MKPDSIELLIAKSRIERYIHDAEDPVIRESKEAQDCMDLEAFIDKGIKALEWLEQSEKTIREAIAEGVIDRDVELLEGANLLYKAWLRPCPFVDKWIEKHTGNGYEIRNLFEFRQCCDRVIDRLQRNQWSDLSAKSRARRLAEEPW